MKILDPILIPNNGCCEIKKELPDRHYLVKDKFLSEFENTDEKESARRNLDVFGRNETYNKLQVDELIKRLLAEYINVHNSDPNSHELNIIIAEIASLYVKKDGSTPFINPQEGIEPIRENHLTTKNYVDEKYVNALKLIEDKFKLLIKDFLLRYPAPYKIALKDEVVRYKKLMCILDGFVRSNGTVPFVKPQRGVNPIEDDHLATKYYVDTKVKEISNFTTLLNEVLELVFTKEEVTNLIKEIQNEVKELKSKIDNIIDNLLSKQLGNNLVKKDDGLYIKVHQTYENGVLKLFINDVEKQSINLGIDSIVKSAKYNPTNESIEIVFNKKSGSTEKVVIPASNLITEWTIDNTNTLELVKSRVVNGKDILKGNVKVSPTNNATVISNTGIYTDKNTSNYLHNSENLEVFLNKIEERLDALISNTIEWEVIL